MFVYQTPNKICECVSFCKESAFNYLFFRDLEYRLLKLSLLQTNKITCRKIVNWPALNPGF